MISSRHISNWLLLVYKKLLILIGANIFNLDAMYYGKEFARSHPLIVAMLLI